MTGARGPIFVLALVGAILLGAGLAYWLDGDGTAPRGGAAELEPRAGEPADGRSADGTDARAGRESPESADRGRSATAAVPPEVPRGTLSGRVVNGEGRALAGARILLTREEAREFTVLDRDDTTSVVGETLSDDAGAFDFELPRGAPVDVRASLAGFCDALVTDAYAGQELELVLERGFHVYGTITRARDGSPVEGADVRAFSPGGPASLERATRSGADGAYELRLPLRADVTLEVVPRVERCSGWIELAFGADDSCRQDVALEEGVTIAGRVTDAASGQPIEGALVGEGRWFRRTATTDGRGEYRLPGFGDPAVREVGARAAGYTAARAEPKLVAVAGIVRADFALHRGRAVRGRIVDESGAPVAGAYVAAVASEWVEGAQRTEWASARSGTDGRYLVDGLAVELGHALLVTRPGYGTQVHDLPENELAPDRRGATELELPDVVLRRPALLAGRVEDPAGNALADVELELSGWNHDRFRFTREEAAHGRYYVDRRSLRSDARGRFWCGDLPAGRYRLVTRVAGRPESAPLEFELATGERREDLVLRLDAGGTIRGQVVDALGQPLSGVYVSAQGERLHDGSARPAGHVHVRTEADGLFELAGLPAGEYTLRAYPLETQSDPDEPWLAATVEHVATGAQPIQIELPRGSSIRGVLLDALGVPLPGYVVATAGTGAAGSPEFVQTDVRGRFALNVPRGSTWTIEVRGSPEAGTFQTVFLERTGVSAGTRELVLRLER